MSLRASPEKLLGDIRVVQNHVQVEKASVNWYHVTKFLHYLSFTVHYPY